MTKQQSPDLPKIILLSVLLLFIFSVSSTLMTLYPQRLLVSDSTSIDSILKFTDKSITLRGNQIQPTSEDLIPLEGRDYIKLSGNQIQIGDDIYREGVRTLSPSFFQNILFESFVGQFLPNQSVKIGIDNELIILTSISDSIRVQSPGSDYNVQFKNGMTYIKTKSVMLRLEKKEVIRIYLVGFKEVQSIWVKPY